MTMEEIKLLLRSKSTAAARSIFLQHRNKVLDKGYHLQAAALDQKWKNALTLHISSTVKKTGKEGEKIRGYNQSKYEPFGVYVVGYFAGESLRYMAELLGLSYSSFVGSLTVSTNRVSRNVMNKVVLGIMEISGKTAAEVKEEISLLPVDVVVKL
tara:strand:- start:532 stop:996 length:465 start_codon:yes stop_codon:yes gene_type:complete